MANNKFFHLCNLLLVFFLVSSSACASQIAPGQPNVWIDVPVDGREVPENTVVQIEGHASHRGSIHHLELYANEIQLAVLEDLEQEDGLARFAFQWLPPTPGEYLIQAVAFDETGISSEADQARVIVGAAAPQPDIEESAEPDEIVPPTSPPDVVIDFWADPAEIAADECTHLKWHVENVSKVFFGNQEQPLDGSYRVCLCEDELYSLHVTLNDGTEEVRKVTVKVTGTCAEPEEEPPAPDTTAPAVPTPVVPGNGSEIACKSFQTLNWLPVTDPSGISGYDVQVQRHSGDNNWADISGSVFNISTGKSVDISVECGWYYRWRVLSKDGAGYKSTWSGWWTFTIVLS